MCAARLTFFCELAAEPLQELFSDQSVIDDLVSLGAEVSLGTLDVGPERSEVVRRLNQAGVPVAAWILLPEDQGYWPNAANVSAVAERYGALRAWTAEQGLRWSGIALDVEPDVREIRKLLADWRAALPGMLGRFFGNSGLTPATRAYAELVARMHADGYSVDSYVIPLIADEHQIGSTLLQRVGGIVDVPVDREVPMLYLSFLRPLGLAFLWSYAKEFRSVGVGSTGGGVEIVGVSEVPPLNWQELSYDLRLARRFTDDIFVFSLEGCVRQGFLGKILTLDWSEPVDLPASLPERVDQFRGWLRAVLWADAHATDLAIGLIATLWLLRGFGRRQPRRRGRSATHRRLR